MVYKKIYLKINYCLNLKFIINHFFIDFNPLFLFKKFKKKIIFFFSKKKVFFLKLSSIKKKKKVYKKKSKIGRLKEIKIKINIDLRDYKIKVKKANVFLLEGYNVKISVIFRGREIIFKEKGIELILKFQNNIKGVYFSFSDIELDGRCLSSIFIPKKNDQKKNKKNFI